MSKVHSTCEQGFLVTSKARNHVILSDEPVDVGGGDTAATPGELLLSAVGSCMADTAKAYAKRKGWPLEKVEVELESQRTSPDDYPDHKNLDGRKQLVVINTKIRFYGPLDEKQIARIKEISGRCPVHKLVAGGVHFVDELID